MGDGIESVRKVLHHRGDTAPTPSSCKYEISEQETGGISNVESRCGNPRAICNASSPGKRPRAEPGHEAAKTSNQPWNPAPSSKIFSRPSIEAHYIEAHDNHQ